MPNDSNIKSSSNPSPFKYSASLWEQETFGIVGSFIYIYFVFFVNFFKIKIKLLN
jgi:hypothetical protein